MSKSTVLLVELHMMKQRLERTDVCCRIRWSHREQTSFWETQVSNNLRTSAKQKKQKDKSSLSVSLSLTCLHKMQMSPACFQQGRRICISKKKQQHSTVDTGSYITYTQSPKCTQSIQKENIDLPTPSFHFGWESDKCQENKQCSQGFPRKFPREAKKNDL